MLPTIALADIVSYLDDLLDVAKYEDDGASNGLMVDAAKPVTRIAAAVNTSFASIRSASRVGAQLLLVHHTTWESIDLHLKAEKEEALRTAGISLYGAHAALDCAPGLGNGDALANLIGLRIEGRFAPFADGRAGVYGTVGGSFEGLVERLGQVLGVPVASWKNDDSFGRVAVVAGAAGRTALLDEARSLGCDTFITGEGSMYTKLFAREVGMNLILATHYATEAPGIRALATRVAGRFGLPWSFVTEDADIL